MKVIVDNLAVNYELTGEGKLVLLLHGWGDDATTFRRLIKSLNKTFQTLTLDLPGFGATQAPNAIWGLEDYSDFLVEFLAKLELPTPYAIIGHSNGGAVAIKALGERKLIADKLVLLAPSGIRNNQVVKRYITMVLAKVGKLTSLWLPAAYRQRLRRRLYGSIGSDLLVAPQLEGTFKKMVRQDVQEEAAKLEMPVLLVFALKDPAIPIADGKRYHELMHNSQLITLDSNSHFIHQDQADEVEALIKDFL